MAAQICPKCEECFEWARRYEHKCKVIEDEEDNTLCSNCGEHFTDCVCEEEEEQDDN